MSDIRASGDRAFGAFGTTWFCAPWAYLLHARRFQAGQGVTAISEFVFHKAGRPIGQFDGTWKRACRLAGVPGRLFHDLRRTAVRNMIRAGVPQAVAMSISGHRTVSMFMPYNITSDEDMRAALLRTQEYVD